MYDDYFKNIIGGSIKSPEYYVSTYDNHTYQPRQVSALPGYNYSADTNFNDNDIEDLYPDIYKIVSPMVDKLLDGKTFDNVNEDMLVKWTVEIYDALEVDDDNTKLVNDNVAKTGSSVISNGTSRSNVNQGVAGNSSNNTIRPGSNYESETTSARTAQRTVLSNTVANTPSNTMTKAGITTPSSTISSTAVNTSSNSITNTGVSASPNTVNNATVNAISNSTTNKEPKVVDVVSRYRNYKNPLLRDLIRILILNKLYGNRRPPRGMPRPYQDFEPTFIPMPDYSSVNTEVYKPYTNYSKAYLDTPYPEE